VPHDPGDPVLNTWILWWNAHALPFTDRWWNAPIFVPLPGALALSEHLLGLAIVASPMQLAGASPLAAYNVSLLLSYALSGFFAYLLALRLTGSPLASACAGLAFAFAPYRAGQLAHIQVLTSQWMPAMLLGMHGYMDTGRLRWLLLFAAAWLLQALSNGYYMLFLPALIVPWLAWFTRWPIGASRALGLLAGWIASSLPLLPAVIGYRTVHEALGLSRSLGDIRQFSATLRSFVQPPPLLALWPAGSAASQEHYLFPGLTVPLLLVAALAAVLVRRISGRAVEARSPLIFYSLAGILMFVLAMGPGGAADGPPSLVRPYTWLLHLPGYDALRVPARFTMLGALCLAVAAGCAVGSSVRRGARWRQGAALAILAGVCLDGLMVRVPLTPPPARIALADLPPSRVIEIPPDDPLVSAAAMYRAIYHRRPLVNGYSGHIAPHYAVLSLALWRGDTSVLRALARDRPLAIIVNARADPAGGFRRMVEDMPAVSLSGITAVGPLFLLSEQPKPSSLPDGKLPCAPRGVAAQRLQLDCGDRHTISAIEFALRGRYRELAERILIEASDDGLTWQEAWVGWTGEFALEATLQDPVVVPVRIPLPQIRSRYLRIYPAPDWMENETGVLGR
jgi:hypothetical protein